MAPIPNNAAAPVRPTSRLASSVFQEHSRELQRFLLRRVGNRHDADDLSQEVFARLLRIEKVELIRDPLAYLLGIAAHVVHEFLSRKQQQCVVYSSEVADFACDSLDAVRDLATTTDQLDLQNWLLDAMTHLSPTHQAVLLLVKRDGLSYEEAAAATGLSIHTIEKYLVEARARLRRMLQEPQP